MNVRSIWRTAVVATVVAARARPRHHRLHFPRRARPWRLRVPAAGCMGTGWHVRPGASTAPTLHPACDVSADEYLVGTNVRVTVIYRDDRGDVGQVTATSTITGMPGGGG
jgi:hypothetical protein